MNSTITSWRGFTFSVCFGLFRISVTVLHAGFMLVTAVTPAAAQSAPTGALNTVAQVRALTPQQAAESLPVRLKGIVTFWDEDIYSRFIQDETAGIYLGENTNLPAVMPGQIVEIEGVTGPGEYAPIVIPVSARVVGEGSLPPAKLVSVEELLSGREDSQFIEIKGIVRSARFSGDIKRYLIDLVICGERFTAYARELPVREPEQLVDSVVRIRGVCSTLFNRQRQLFGFRLLVVRPADIVIEQAAPPNPFAVPTQSINSLLRFAPQGAFGHRVKVAGIVVYHEPGSALFIQDENEGLYCQTRQRAVVKAGDRVEVLGFPAKGEYNPVLQDSIFRKVGDGPAPVPASLNLDEILAATHDCRLIETTANLVERTERGRERFLVLEKDGVTFHAYLGQDIASGMGFPPMRNGSEVLVRGICLIERGSNWRAGESWRAKSFRLLLRSPEDVVVQKAPPLWEQVGAGRIIGVLAIIILAAVLWISILHRRIEAHRQGKI